MITVKAGWSMKAPTGQYKSIGSWVEVVVELDDDLWTAERRNDLELEMANIQVMTKKRVETQVAIAIQEAKDVAGLADEQDDDVDVEPPPRREERPREPARDARPAREPRREERPARDEPRGHSRSIDRRRERGGNGGGSARDWERNPPAHGADVFGYCNDQSKTGDKRPFRWFEKWAKKNNMPASFKDWDDRDALDAWDDYCEARDAAEPAERNGGSHR